MRDVIYLLITVAFFAVCVGLIKGCDLVIGPDEFDDPDGEVIRETQSAVTP